MHRFYNIVPWPLIFLLMIALAPSCSFSQDQPTDPQGTSLNAPIIPTDAINNQLPSEQTIKANDVQHSINVLDPFSAKNKLSQPTLNAAPEANTAPAPSPSASPSAAPAAPVSPNVNSATESATELAPAALDLLNEENDKKSEEVPLDPLEQELLQGDSNSFKTAPLKVEDLPESKNQLKNETQNSVPENATTTSSSDTSAPDTSITDFNQDFSATSNNNATENTPNTNSIALPPTPLQNNNELIDQKILDQSKKTMNLIHEEEDPWDDPHKPITPECRSYLERIKIKTVTSGKVTAALQRIQDALNSKHKLSTDQQSKLESLFKKLAKNEKMLLDSITNLKTKAVRMGCPGVEL